MATIVWFEKEMLDKFVEFRKLCAKDSPYLNSTTRQKAEEILESMEKNEFHHYYLLMMKGKIIGQLEIIRDNYTTARITVISVLSDYQGRGYGKQLMDKAIAVAKFFFSEKSLKGAPHEALMKPKLLKLTVHHDNAAAIKLYRKRGFYTDSPKSAVNQLYKWEVE